MLINKTVIKILTFEFFFPLLLFLSTIVASQPTIAASEHC